jgi:hypothetical protein
MWGAAAATVVLVGAIAVFAGARVDAATMGLMAVAASLGLVLRATYQIASALRQPTVEAELATEGALGLASQRQLREEKRRLVRAINELTFDHEMGKLSDEDYRAVRNKYDLQAVDVIRALDANADLHPRLREQLAALEPGGAAADAPVQDDAAPRDAAEDAAEDAPAEDAPAANAPAEDAPAADPPVCPACETVNDGDARFCKKCGKELAA